jgi:hypothetical protein
VGKVMDGTQLEQVLDFCADEFAAFCVKAALPVPDGPVDKYGSYVFETGAFVHGLNRYITLAVTPLTDARRVALEYQMGVDDGRRFWRHQFTRQPFVRDLFAGVKPRPAHDLLGTWKTIVETVRPSDLTDEYAVPRPNAMPEPSNAAPR